MFINNIPWFLLSCSIRTRFYWPWDLFGKYNLSSYVKETLYSSHDISFLRTYYALLWAFYMSYEHFNPQKNYGRKAICQIFYRGRNWGTERLSNLPESTNLVNNRTEFKPRKPGLKTCASQYALKVILIFKYA